jgi:hypothetical protein
MKVVSLLGTTLERPTIQPRHPRHDRLRLRFKTQCKLIERAWKRRDGEAWVDLGGEA